jgi:hypothetical protein
MQKSNKVSIWVGKFGSKNDFNKFIAEQYDENGNCSSVFMKEFEMDFIDCDFQESVFTDNGLTKEYLMRASYIETFIDKIDDALLTGNSIIMLYDFEYSGKIQAKNSVNFIGTYEYKK